MEQFDLSGRNEIQVDRRNNQERLKLYANSSGGLTQKLDYILKGQIFWSQRLIGSNGQLLSLSNRSSMLELSLIYLIGQSVLTFNPQWFFLNSSTAAAKASQSIYRLKYYTHFSDWGALRIEGGAICQYRRW